MCDDRAVYSRPGAGDCVRGRGFGRRPESSAADPATVGGAFDFRGREPYRPARSVHPKASPRESGLRHLRLVDVPAHLHRFEPESSEESKAVTTLTGSGWSVWLRLAGRGLMEPDRTEQFNEQSIRRPIAVTDQELPVNTPRPRDLKQIAGRALALSGTADLALGSVGRWSVEARVVRADRKACVDCHSRDDKARSPRVEGRGQGPMKVGDALGVVIYVFTRSQGR